MARDFRFNLYDREEPSRVDSGGASEGVTTRLGETKNMEARRIWDTKS